MAANKLLMVVLVSTLNACAAIEVQFYRPVADAKHVVGSSCRGAAGVAGTHKQDIRGVTQFVRISGNYLQVIYEVDEHDDFRIVDFVSTVSSPVNPANDKMKVPLSQWVDGELKEVGEGAIKPPVVLRSCGILGIANCKKIKSYHFDMMINEPILNAKELVVAPPEFQVNGVRAKSKPIVFERVIERVLLTAAC